MRTYSYRRRLILWLNGVNFFANWFFTKHTHCYG